MFRFNLEFKNPFYVYKKESFLYKHRKEFVNFYKVFTKLNKYLEFKIDFNQYFKNLFILDIDICSDNISHAGINIYFELCKLYISFSFCDTRHWDHENDCWENNN